MRFSPLILAALATTVVAQTPEPAPAPSQPGLSDLQGTVESLQDRPAPTPVPTPVPTTTPAPSQPLAPPQRRPTVGAPPLIQSEIADLNRVSARGRQLVAISRAGIIATQDMLSRVSNPDSSGIDGWVAEVEGASTTVTFYDNADDGPKVVYRATVQGPRVTSRDTFLGTFRPPLPRTAARLATARNAVQALNHSACSPQGFNYLVIPPTTASGPIEVYEISAPSQRGRFPIGGHFRTSVTGDRVGESHAFATSCADLTVTDPPAGQQPRPIEVAAGPDPWPTEVHVLVSQMSGRALLFSAGTPARQWLVAGARIAEIRDGAPRWVTTQE